MNIQIHSQKKPKQKRTEIKHCSLRRIHHLPLDLHLITVKGAEQLNQRENAFSSDSLSRCVFK